MSKFLCKNVDGSEMWKVIDDVVECFGWNNAVEDFDLCEAYSRNLLRSKYLQ